MEHLRACFGALPADRAVGIDGITKEQYGEHLDENLRKLSERLRNMGYRPRAKRRTYIPKPGSAKGRPLAISCFEDKLVELALKRVLEPIYEVQFEDSSYGYRPGRSQHQCLDDLGRTLQQRRVNHVVEADIRSFFNTVDHDWMLTFLRHRIGDPRIIRLIGRLLKGGILEDGLVQASEEGTPQGSILSPLLSNIYLHYVLDLWFSRRVRPQSNGEAYYYRYADDFVAAFQHRQDAARFHAALDERLRQFRLRLAEEKTRCPAFGRFARENARQRGEKPEEFTFLGFTHYCGKSKQGHFKVKRRYLSARSSGPACGRSAIGHATPGTSRPREKCSPAPRRGCRDTLPTTPSRTTHAAAIATSTTPPAFCGTGSTARASVRRTTGTNTTTSYAPLPGPACRSAST
jgi:group II intron reverse transcriptase/maturase